MRILVKLQLFAYSLILVGGGIFAWYFWKNELPFTHKDLFQVSLSIDAEINDVLVAWGVQDSDVINEYRKEVAEKNRLWIVVNRDITISPELLPEQYQELLKKSVRSAGGETYRCEKKGSKIIFEAGANNKILNRLIFTVLRKKTPGNAYAAIVIDDVGFNKNVIKPFLQLGIPLTFAILPREQFSQEAAEIIHRSGNDIIVHMPMEPKDYPKTNPGSAALLCKMNDEEIRNNFFDNLNSIPFAVGINNHMGSRFMEDKQKADIFFACVKETNLFFLDSRTTDQSAFPDIAQEIFIPRLVNDVFLDGEDDAQYIERQLILLAHRAKEMRTAVGIAHVHRKNAPIAIKKSLQYFKYQGIELITLSELLRLSQKK